MFQSCRERQLWGILALLALASYDIQDRSLRVKLPAKDTRRYDRELACCGGANPMHIGEK
jgi:hypothetical protein